MGGKETSISRQLVMLSSRRTRRKLCRIQTGGVLAPLQPFLACDLRVR